MFHVRLSVHENTLSVEQLARLGISEESITAMVVQAPCSWVAEEAEAIVGFAMVDIASACLFAVFVLPSHEGKGLGKLLIQRCEDALFAHHAAIWLETDGRSRAARLYRAQGWREEADLGGGDVRMGKQRSQVA